MRQQISEISKESAQTHLCVVYYPLIVNAQMREASTSKRGDSSPVNITYGRRLPEGGKTDMRPKEFCRPSGKHTSVRTSIHLSVCLSVALPLHLSPCLCTNLSLQDFLSIFLCVSLSTSLSICLSIHHLFRETCSLLLLFLPVYSFFVLRCVSSTARADVSFLHYEEGGDKRGDHTSNYIFAKSTEKWQCYETEEEVICSFCSLVSLVDRNTR